MQAIAMKLPRNVEKFDLEVYFTDAVQFDDLLKVPEGRRVLTEDDPLLFALIYLPHHLKHPSTGDTITFSDFHLDLIRQAKHWVKPSHNPRTHRDAYIAPRDTGKSTWLFTILPLWAAAHGHVKFVAAFADSSPQAEQHLDTFRNEIVRNELLRNDFPGLLTSHKQYDNVTKDNRTQYTSNSGFTFMAKGIDSSSLGMKIGERRPDLIILDDVEPDEANYSTYQIDKRLSSVINTILPLNESARVVIVGTVVMPGSIIHQMMKQVKEPNDCPDWVAEQNIKVHHYEPIIMRKDGTERSLWPAKWSMDYLNLIRNNRDYKLNFENDPLGAEGDYWTNDDFTIKPDVDLPARGWLISIDPAVTEKRSSDFTGVAIIAWCQHDNQFAVVDCVPLKLSPEKLREHCIRTIEHYPEINRILVETNQGGDVWKSILHHMPVPISTVQQSVKKEVRAAALLNHYQRGRIVHTKQLTHLQEQMIAFPGRNDDLVDAVGSGVEFLIRRMKAKQTNRIPNARQLSYI
jgi:predicted phage terminase large subunit-like protein